MTSLFPTLSIAFAAFCVWLTVRIVNRRERWARWTLAGVIGVLVAYPLCFCVLYSLAQRGLLKDETRLAIGPVYAPVEWTINNSEGWARVAILKFLSLWEP